MATKELNKLLEQTGMSSVYRIYQKRADRGTASKQEISQALRRETLVTAEKCFLDPQVFTCFILPVFSIMKKKVSFVAIDEGKKKGINKSKEMASFLNFSLDTIEEGGVRQLIFDMLTAKFFGWSLVERVYDVFRAEQTSKYKDFYYYKYLIGLPIGLWDFVKDDKGNIVGYKRIDTYQDSQKTWSQNKFIRLTYLPLFGNKNGTSDFEKVFETYDAKIEFVLFILELGARLSKGRQTILKGTQGTKYDADEIDEALESLANNLVSYIPPGYEVNFSNFDVNALQYFLAVLRWLDSQIAIAMLGSSLSVNESQQTGTFAQSKVHQENTFLFEEYLMSLITDAMDKQYAKSLLKLNYDPLNYPEELYPKAKLILEESENPLDLISVFEKLKGMGAIDLDTEIDLNFIREKFDLPENPELFDKAIQIMDNFNKSTKKNSTDNTQTNTDNIDASNLDTVNNLAEFYK